MDISIFILAAYYLTAFGFLLVTGLYPHLLAYRPLAKGLTSLGFIFIGFYAALLGGTGNFFKRLFPAFLLCLAGDLFLALKNGKYAKNFFIWGLLSFLMGHLFFTLSYEIVAPFKWYQMLIPLLGVLIALKLLSLKNMNTEGMGNYILLYAFFVTLLFGKSVFVWLSLQNVFGALTLIGGTLFLISDLVLLFVYFYFPKNTWTKILNMVTYYGAMAFLAISVYYY